MPIYLIMLELLLQGFSVLHACDFYVSVKSQMFLLITCRMTRGFGHREGGRAHGGQADRQVLTIL
jgi:hypothetical protein